MPKQPKNCGICGAPAIENIIEQAIPAMGVSEAYTRVVHETCFEDDKAVAEEVAAELAAAEVEVSDE